MISKIIPLSVEYLKVKVNCYLIQTDSGFFLVDTGWQRKGAELATKLESAGCKPGNLKLILLTHGDFDHAGNAADLRERFGTKIAMHPADAGNVESGDMFGNKKVSPISKAFVKIFMAIFGMGRFRTFSPDICLEDGQSLSGYGLDATVLYLPGHSKGSISFLTASGELICGDLLESTKKPAVNSLVDDPAQMTASVKRLKGFPIATVYPGHGDPFPYEALNQ